jgi:hypothetical protein
MTDSQDKGRVIDDGINNPIMADSEFPESGKFPREGWESVGLFGQIFFDFSQDPFRLVLFYLLEVA